MSRSVWKHSHVDINLLKRFDELISFSIIVFKQRNELDDLILNKKTLQQHIIEISLIARILSEENPIEVWSRNSVVLPEFLGFSFLIYNGHVFQKIIVKQNMLGRKFGEFAVTKRIGPNIHYPKKKKKKK